MRWLINGAARPVAEHYHKIGVGLDLSLRDIFHIDLKGGQIGIRLWETFRWQDVLLAWRRSDFQGIDNVRVPMSNPIWMPDIQLINSLDDFPKFDKSLLAHVNSMGVVSYTRPANHKIRCRLVEGKTIRFNCTLSYSSWMNDDSRLTFGFFNGSQGLDIRSCSKNPRIKLLNVSSWKTSSHLHSNADLSFRTLHFSFRMIIIERKNGDKKNNKKENAGRVSKEADSNDKDNIDLNPESIGEIIILQDTEIREGLPPRGLVTDTN